MSIVFFTEEETLKKNFQNIFDNFNISSIYLPINEKKSLEFLYEEEKSIKGLITQVKNPHFPGQVWFDLLDSLSQRIPVICLGDMPRVIARGEARGHRIFWLSNPTAQDVLSVFDACGALGISQKNLYSGYIPPYNPILSLHMLRNTGFLSILTISAVDMKKIAIEYGNQAYETLQNCFKEVLIELWGSVGSFRTRDVLCQSLNNTNTFYVILEHARSDIGMPQPSSLEKLADRVAIKLQSLLWQEVQKPQSTRKLPSYLKFIPDFYIGYGTTIYNPCVDSIENIDALIATSLEMAKLQKTRMKNRKRELIQVLAQTDRLLIPYYQGVFDLQTLSLEEVEEAKQENSIRPLKSHIYSFESLIRVNQNKAEKLCEDLSPIFLDPKNLRPDVLFDMASYSHLALELDQTCLRSATANFAPLPGKLMVNILPRNFYHIDELKSFIPEGMDVIFEVSEAEAINNFDLLLKSREKLVFASQNFGIAIDDFGQGFSGLDRIIKIKPDMIKLDRSLISFIDQDEPKRTFVAGLIEASLKTNSIILAEGVERIEEMLLLKNLGVHLIQGFLVHKPQSRQDILSALEADDEQSSYQTVA